MSSIAITLPGAMPRHAASARRTLWPHALLRAIALSAFFLLIYGACNALTHHRVMAGERIPSFYFAWERLIPFVPAFIVPYMSIDLLFVASFFVCIERRELRAHTARIIIATSIAAIFFIATPLQYGFARPEVSGFFAPMFDALYRFDHPYNLAPSLHIALRSLLWVIFVRHTRGLLRGATRVWFILIGLSTLFVHQHHVIDLATGQALAMLCLWLVPDEAFDSRRRVIAWPRNARVGSFYAMGSLACIGAALVANRFGWLMTWPAMSLAIVAAGYFGLGPTIFRKRDGRLPMRTWFVLWPYLLGANLALLIQRPRERASKIARNVSISTRPTRSTAFNAVLDLTAEFSAPGSVRNGIYLNIPILDLTPPTVEQLRRAVRFIEAHAPNHRVCVCCALGYSRAACVAAAYLIHSGAATTVDQAVAIVRGARPKVVIRREHRAVLEAFARGGET